jgi:hypothetical protein
MLPPCLLILRRPPSQRTVLPIEPRDVCSRGLKIGSDDRHVEMLAFMQTKSSTGAKIEVRLLKTWLFAYLRDIFWGGLPRHCRAFAAPAGLV